MSSSNVSLFLRAWKKWKTLRLPWRNQFLIGTDLNGHTFWEFKDVRGSDYGRWRRIVKYDRKTHLSDVSVPPAWHQWLRNTRQDPPSLEEQRADVVRQERMKALAAQADARWAAKPRLVDAPGAPRGPHRPALGSIPVAAERVGHQPLDTESNHHVETSQADRQETWRKMQQQPKPPAGVDPWKRHRSGPSEEWQPDVWKPRPPTREP